MTLPNGIYPAGSGFEVRVKLAGRPLRRKADTLEDATLILRTLRGIADEGSADTPTLAELWAGYEVVCKLRHRSWARDVAAWAALSPTFGKVQIGALSRKMVTAYQARRIVGVEAGTVNREVAVLRALCSWAVEEGIIEHSPLAGMHDLTPGPARQPVLSQDDEAALLGALPGWVARAARLALATGMRIGEIRALRWNDWDPEAGCWSVRDSKSGESRRVPCPRALVEAMAGGVPQLRTAPVCPGPDGEELTICSVDRSMFRTGQKLGLSIRFHDLRHVAATRFLSAGASLPEIAALLGHKTLSIARRYAHATWGRLGRIVEAASVGGQV